MNTVGKVREKIVSIWGSVPQLSISVIFRPVIDLIRLKMPPYRITVAQKIVISKFYYPYKFAVFQISTVYRFQGSR